MNTSSCWYIVYTKPKMEKKVAKRLGKQNIVSFCPHHLVEKQGHSGKTVMEEPLFSSYVFVQIPAPELLVVKNIQGVLNLVYWLGSPAIVRTEEIETIKKFLLHHRHVQVERVSMKNYRSIQSFEATPLQREEPATEVIAKRTKVLLPSLGYALVAQVEKPNLEVVHARGQGKKALHVKHPAYKLA